MTIRTRVALGVSAAVLSLGLALAPAALAQDKMSKDDGMKKDTMSKDNMKDNMKKDSMSKDSMSKDSMSKDGMKKDDNMMKKNWSGSSADAGLPKRQACFASDQLPRVVGYFFLPRTLRAA